MTIAQRKNQHLDICLNEPVQHRGTTLLEEVQLVHEALPEADLDEIDLATQFCGKRLAAPIVIGAMTGGTAKACGINCALAEAAQRHGLTLAVGSQRAMWIDPSKSGTYRVRDLAPDVPILANIGVVQAREMGGKAVRRLVESIEADGICIHLNPAQELSQTEGDRHFAGCLSAIADVAQELEFPVIVKETGCGLGPRTLDGLMSVGIEYVEVAGAGGTSWPRVEGRRSGNGGGTGELLGDWGIPTAASIGYAARRGFSVTASGGIRDAMDVVRSLALGADRAAMALPFLKALHEGGPEGLDEFAAELVYSLKAAMLLSGARTVTELQRVPRFLGPNLSSWLALDKRNGE